MGKFWTWTHFRWIPDAIAGCQIGVHVLLRPRLDDFYPFHPGNSTEIRFRCSQKSMTHPKYLKFRLKNSEKSKNIPKFRMVRNSTTLMLVCLRIWLYIHDTPIFTISIKNKKFKNYALIHLNHQKHI
jgi:hypothetical protein